MSELLTSLRTKKNDLDLKVSSLTLDITTNNTNCSDKMKEILTSKFPRVKGVTINRDSITIQVRSDDERFTHDVTISNTNTGLYNWNYNQEFTYNPRLQWNSGSAKRESSTMLSYINVVAFVASEFMKSDSEFSNLMEFAWKSVHEKNNELTVTKSELQRTVSQLQQEELRIKKELFYMKMKTGNYYYKVVSNYGRVVYHIAHIDKINPKTVAVSMTASDGNDGAIDRLGVKGMRSRRVKPYQLYTLLNEFTLFDRKNFKEMVIDGKFKMSIDYVRRQKGMNTVMDIKLLCQSLKEYNFITENVPSNDILHYISKWRHYTIENNRS